ncbi:hypothetical protein SKAU_G00375640 [Synaphobranchus kaupii]|uniref:Uncharacterized protein n=1 Tax=Synaphobranchus kaupii TaxID=118154 RepID=A0A9Q1EGW8_SYNKA|nr:hypothetical protein SKAU_G00375640 [Synaphobranchus kaupii]
MCFGQISPPLSTQPPPRRFMALALLLRAKRQTWPAGGRGVRTGSAGAPDRLNLCQGCRCSSSSPPVMSPFSSAPRELTAVTAVLRRHFPSRVPAPRLRPRDITSVSPGGGCVVDARVIRPSVCL